MDAGTVATIVIALEEKRAGLQRKIRGEDAVHYSPQAMQEMVEDVRAIDHALEEVDKSIEAQKNGASPVRAETDPMSRIVELERKKIEAMFEIAQELRQIKESLFATKVGSGDRVPVAELLVGIGNLLAG